MLASSLLALLAGVLLLWQQQQLGALSTPALPRPGAGLGALPRLPAIAQPFSYASQPVSQRLVWEGLLFFLAGVTVTADVCVGMAPCALVALG